MSAEFLIGFILLITFHSLFGVIAGNSGNKVVRKKAGSGSLLFSTREDFRCLAIDLSFSPELMFQPAEEPVYHRFATFFTDSFGERMDIAQTLTQFWALT
jgi:hypothetical protein